MKKNETIKMMFPPQPIDDLIIMQNCLHKWVLAINDKVVVKPNKGENEWFLELMKETRLLTLIDLK